MHLKSKDKARSYTQENIKPCWHIISCNIINDLTDFLLDNMKPALPILLMYKSALHLHFKPQKIFFSLNY